MSIRYKSQCKNTKYETSPHKASQKHKTPDPKKDIKNQDKKGEKKATQNGNNQSLFGILRPLPPIVTKEKVKLSTLPLLVFIAH